MKSKDLESVTRHAWNIVEFSKVTAMQNIAAAVAKGDLKIDRGQLPALLQVVQSSIEQGFTTSVKEFEIQVSVILEDHAKKNSLSREDGTGY